MQALFAERGGNQEEEEEEEEEVEEELGWSEVEGYQGEEEDFILVTFSAKSQVVSLHESSAFRRLAGTSA